MLPLQCNEELRQVMITLCKGEKVQEKHEQVKATKVFLGSVIFFMNTFSTAQVSVGFLQIFGVSASEKTLVSLRSRN